ncbi:type III secretion system ATPase, FliI/YscN [Candidatus Magnetobacterium bavaricum]|uniref:Type III secretion system ATPase, FliI/YscN n=1 Tax=Candidatus Magnetobacterium bavaricum TaxID=29290 RepID=A0A0F3H0G6_9BACT|nr:type III secretion system ATPase, FliI/YscN [Candidatus Magnetobacterium bavaricum]
MSSIDLSPYIKALRDSNPFRVYGRVIEITGMLIKSAGLKASVGEACKICCDNHPPIDAEIVGFKDGKELLMATGDISWVRPGSRVLPMGRKVSIKVGGDLIGRVINESGVPIDGKGPINGINYPIFEVPSNPLSKERIRDVIDMGISTINALLTCGKGQRIGIMSAAGVGKSVLMGMIAKYTKADVNVIALVGERSREVREFIERDLGQEGMQRSVVVVSTSEQSPVAKVKGAFVATAIASYFRSIHKDCLLFMDSLTRVAMAQREIGLAVGEPPASKGYTPSVFALLPKLLERAGTAAGKGSVTGIYTVLVEGDDIADPVADAVMSILDGHIILSRALAMENHYPAIDVLRSISRIMTDIIDDEHKMLAGKFLETLATYKRFEDMINLGAYKEGSNPKVDYSIAMLDALNKYTRQLMNEKSDFNSSIANLRQLFTGQ